MKTRNSELWWDKFFQQDKPCTNHKNTPYKFIVLYLILIHLWNQDKYKLYLLAQVWNKIIAAKQSNLGGKKLFESQSSFTFIIEGDCNVCNTLFAVNATIMRMVYCSGKHTLNGKGNGVNQEWNMILNKCGYVLCLLRDCYFTNRTCTSNICGFKSQKMN